jgi:hypothetical protein
MATKALSYHLHTLFLFTKSDLKTLIPPVVRAAKLWPPALHSLTGFMQTLFALTTAPSCSLFRLQHIILWL